MREIADTFHDEIYRTNIISDRSEVIGNIHENPERKLKKAADTVASAAKGDV